MMPINNLKVIVEEPTSVTSGERLGTIATRAARLWRDGADWRKARPLPATHVTHVVRLRCQVSGRARLPASGAPWLLRLKNGDATIS
jgi:hypothetical protein